MPARRSLARAWRDVDAADRRVLKRHFRALERRLGPFTDYLVVEHAKRVAELALQASAASQAAVVAAGRRARGAGRRPKETAVRTALRRSAMQVTTYEAALARLVQMTESRPVDVARAIQQDLERAEREAGA